MVSEYGQWAISNAEMVAVFANCGEWGHLVAPFGECLMNP